VGGEPPPGGPGAGAGRGPGAASAPGAGFAPWGATTGVGSLPHRSVGDALALIAATCPEVPYWPQLPALDPFEMPLLQALSPVADLLRVERHPNGCAALAADVPEAVLVAQLDARPAVPPPRAVRGLWALLDTVAAGAFPRCRAVKGQLSGPVTIAGALRVEGTVALRRPPVPLVAADLLGHLALQAGDVHAGLARSLVTTACGLALLDPAHAARTSRRAVDVAAHVRRLVLDDLPTLPTLRS
jgi:hypothetical protein